MICVCGVGVKVDVDVVMLTLLLGVKRSVGWLVGGIQFGHMTTYEFSQLNKRIAGHYVRNLFRLPGLQFWLRLT